MSYMSKPVILTGLRANNDLHIGNYLGALLPIVDLARDKSDDYQINLFVPDLHSFTTPIDHNVLQAQIMQNLRVFVASGLPLDNPNVHLYRQSRIQAHSELTWILDCFTHFGELRRMIQFKEKTQTTDKERETYKNKVLDHLINDLSKDEKYANNLTLKNVREIADQAMEYLEKELNKLKLQNASAGLFTYPVLMAADILLYRATYVPVGDDQTQHLEFTRDIGERINNRFNKEIFLLPKSANQQHKFFGNDQGLRIKDLQDPTKKMSKSEESSKGVIFMNDSPEEARKKIMSATTDSLANVAYDPDKQPGISNLLLIHSILTDQDVEDSENHFKGQAQYGEFKKAVADVVVDFLENFQSKLSQVDDKKLLSKLEKSEHEMNIVANKTLEKVQKAVGLRS